MRQVAWVLDHLDDLASDMSVFHRIDDVTLLDGPTFCRLAWRLPAYAGVMQQRVQAVQDEQPTSPTERPFTYGTSPRAEVNPGTKTTLMAEPAFRGVFSFG